jgi:uncharacterized protein with HEPN domain
MAKDNQVFLRHMLDCIRKIETHVGAKSLLIRSGIKMVFFEIWRY